MRKYFGTDGIRGVVGEKITPKIAFDLGKALTLKKSRPNIIVGRDTRISGEALLHSFTSGVLSGGGNVYDLGITSTPSIAFLVKELSFDYGLMITASHNPPEHNGLKLFNNRGEKLSDNDERDIEQLFDKKVALFDGKYHKVKNLLNIYKKLLIGITDLSGMRIAIDCSNGAVSQIASEVLKKMGAEVFKTGISPNGKKINKNCGCLHIDHLKNFMKDKDVDAGFAFDGDADRCIAVDNNGNEIDGDKILYILAKYSDIPSTVVVGTSQTNSVIEKEITKMGKTFIRADVGDKYVLEKLIKHNGVLGGEKAGHIIILNKNNSGDGLLTAIEICKTIKDTGKSLSELNDIKLYPQQIINLSVEDKNIVENKELLSFIQELAQECRVNIRASGTEDLVRIMCEAKEQDDVNRYLSIILEKIKSIINRK